MREEETTIIGVSAGIQHILDVCARAAASTATVLIDGERGTGKELVARAIHNISPRHAQPFVGLNCAAISDGILESELFGHEKGAFTGANQRRIGRFEYANQGTLFFDEVGDMPLSTQIKLLRVIEEREIVRLGNNESIGLDVRLLAATNQSLEDLVATGRFRADLFDRLNVVRITLPPLRSREDDIPLLIEAFMREFCAKNDKDIPAITRPALDKLYRYYWPGNVRELKNCIESMIVTAKSSPLSLNDIPPHISTPPPPPESENLKTVTLRHIVKIVAKYRTNTAASHALGINRTTLYYHIKEANLLAAQSSLRGKS